MQAWMDFVEKLMPRARQSAKAQIEDKCMGGRSLDCRTDAHEKSKKYPDVYCFRCHARMGCGLCTSNPRELFCLRCNDWGSKVAARAHGPFVEDEKQRLDRARQIAKTAIKNGG